VRAISGMVLTAGLVVASWAIAQPAIFDPHGNPQSGVLHVLTDPPSRGDCVQCHPQHGEAAATNPNVLFSSNDNSFCFSTEGVSPCHQARPTNYPLDEHDRLPQGEPDRGYFEANSGGTRRAGVELRGRWPGETIWSDSYTFPDGRLVSPHAFDPDMPRRENGQGLCLNCHDPHGTPNRDLLRAPYGGISGFTDLGAPAAYRMCFQCHGQAGPASMNPASRWIEDYYDSGLNGDHAGHQIRKNPRVATSWPVWVQVGDKLPCYDCHDPHGSSGNDGARRNASLISDQRRTWSDLTGTLTDPTQARNFCYGCHIPSDGIPGTQTVEEIVMNVLSDTDEHRSSGMQSCYDCHGADYGGSVGNNVHNPAPGTGSGFESFPGQRW
jgi:Doubled CXXCH motif (Paired_CXXCH_1)